MYQIEEIKNKILCGDALEELKKIPDESIDTIITSPPYWNLRDYRVEGQIGLEKTLEEYLEKLLAITAELKRVLKPTGTLWWNHGWAYQNKCLDLQNFRLLTRMIDEQGFILRNCVIWEKPNHMPSSVKDRLTNSYEPVFFLVKSRRYFFDLDAIRVPHKAGNYGGFNTEYEYRMNLRKNKIYQHHSPYTQRIGENKFNYRVRDAEKKSKQCPQFKATREEIERYKRTHYPQDQAESSGSPRARYWRETEKPYHPAGDPTIHGMRLPPQPNQEGAFHPLGKNPGDILSVEEVSDFPIFAVETHTTILGIEEFKNFSNFVSFVVNKLINSSFTMSLRLDEANATGRSENFRNFREELLSASPIQPNLISIGGNPYATITIKQSPNEISIEFGRNRWIFRSEGFSNSDTSLDKTNSQFFAINTKIVNVPFLILMNWVSGLPLSFDVINQLNVFRSKSDGIRFSSFHNTTISQEQAQDISGMRSKFAKVFFIESMLCSADVICSSISEKFMVVSTTKKTANGGLTTNFTNFPHIINISDFNDKVNTTSDVWKIPTQPAPPEVRGKHFACVTPDTEILTEDGWKNYKEIKWQSRIKVATYNLKKKIIEYQPISYLREYDYDGELIKIGNRDLDILTTPNHRNVVISKNTGKEGIILSEKLNNNYKIKVLAPFEYKSTYSIGKNWAELVGWIVSEGHYKKYKNGGYIEIYQNVGKNEKRIDYLLKEIPHIKHIRKRVYRGKERKQVIWFIKKCAFTDWLYKFVPNKELNKLLVSLPKNELKKLFMGLVLGDGNIRKDGRISFIQKSKNCKDWFEILAMKLGYHPTMTKNVVYLTKRTEIGFKGSIRRIKYKGKVWCPTTPNGTWVAKRNGRIFITGNSFPEKLVEPMILAGCPSNGIVLDPFAGSCTTAVVAKKLGRSYIMIEINPEYCEVGRKRLEKIPSPLPLEEQ